MFLDIQSDIMKYFTKKGQPVIDALIVLLIGWYGSKLLLFIIIRMMKKAQVDSIVISFVKSILDVCLKFLVFVTALAQLGVNISSLVTVIATAGAAIVLGLKDSMTGIVSGMIILFTKPFEKGDIIEVNGYIGKIEEIQMMYTFLLTFDNKMVVIPNNELATSIFVNYSHENKRRVDIAFDIHYENDVEKAKQIILDVVNQHPLSIKEPKPYARVGEYKDHSISINARVWAKTDDFYVLKDDLLEQVKKQFDEQGISIPYPQLDVHIQKEQQ